MSAEDELTVLRMENGEYWICVQRCGDTIEECWGEIRWVVTKANSYNEAANRFRAHRDRNSKDYVYTEYGGEMPSEDELARMQPCYLESTLWVVFGERDECQCIYESYVSRRGWVVIERSESQKSRVLAHHITYAEAMTLAYFYEMRHPSICKTRAPRIFQTDPVKTESGHFCVQSFRWLGTERSERNL